LKQLFIKEIFLTGSSGFVGKSLIEYFRNRFSIKKFEKNAPIIVNGSIVVHLAGKAHDLTKVSNTSEYYSVNTELTKNLFDAFLLSDAKVFITLSSVKASADILESELTEDCVPNPITHYGKSKLLAEKYILSKSIPDCKRFYILRPCMIHGPGNKGNLNLLYKLVTRGLPWPLGAFENKRSFCSIDNLMFIINELIEREDIPSGLYNVSDDTALSTNEVISILAESKNKKPKIWSLPKGLIQSFSKLGDVLRLPLTSERLQKLTESYVVSNQKIKSAIGKELPVSAKDGLLKTFNSFNTNAK
jgi:nucleoside-diphosphate-sugar epimerase